MPEVLFKLKKTPSNLYKKLVVFFPSNEMSSLHINYIVITELPGGKEFLLLLAKIKIITDG